MELRGYDEWKQTEPRSSYDECEICGKNCWRETCDTCGRICKHSADCTEDNYCSPICAAAGGL